MGLYGALFWVGGGGGENILGWWGRVGMSGGDGGDINIEISEVDHYTWIFNFFT